MSVEDEFAKELAKQLPVKAIYDDAGSPAAKEAGQLLADLVKTLRLALFGVQFLAAVQDRYRRFIDKSVRQVPPDRRIAPPPQIVGPVLEGIKYEPEGTPIEEMFSQLLSRSMDKDGINNAHPAYPLIIKQLSSDEARLLLLLLDRTYRFVRRWSLRLSVRLLGRPFRRPPVLCPCWSTFFVYFVYFVYFPKSRPCLSLYLVLRSRFLQVSAI